MTRNQQTPSPATQAATRAHGQQLLAMRAALLEQIRLQRGGELDRAQVAADHFERREDSSAQVASEREMEFALNERETGELAVIDAALTRIEAGTYGQCIDCGCPIAEARLQASPEVPRCIRCQEKFEQSHPD
ncbi:MAG: TraR/DksA family transcriptional regulator [Polaromonas sp.]